MHYQLISPDVWLDLLKLPNVSKNSVNSLRITGREYDSPSFHLLVGSDKKFYALIAQGNQKAEVALSKISKAGLEIQLIPEYEFLAEQHTEAIAISCANQDLVRPFCALIKELAELVLENGIEPIEATNSVISKWSYFWGDARNELPLSKERITGLLGELLFLKKCVISEKAMIHGWSGAEGMEQDFAWLTNKIEVKTTELPEPIHRIHGLYQLDDMKSGPLFLISIMIRRISETQNALTLPVLITGITNQIPELDRPVFFEKLRKIGYSPDHDLIYNEYKFKLVSFSIHRVDENFPRIISTSFTKVPSDRISRIEYSINCAGLDKIEENSFLDLLFNSKSL